ncbi:response regulator transcription factor [Vagococcus sp. BWB3-3]|uniref:Response regulator transcription factor n=1 Tax=Vagococcus allomyrinae TaxID=2794353 RepID=A0A940P6Z3_9ENTE|nr:response regulator transcription factor [Vagococcus allomyrinae]MBP1040891.1 response regulator transcription factor [Vagococcus allomyrinae]
MAYILVAEDELSINRLISKNLQLVGHHIVQAFSGEEVLQQVILEKFDLILLDVMLPKVDGFEIARQLEHTVPIIFITARTNLSDRLAGLGLGADDYIVKPFEILELLARVGAVLRRTQKQEKVFTHDNVSVDLLTRQVFFNHQEVPLTPKEYELLQTLVLNRNLALSREKLLELVWGYDFMGDSRTVDVHIQKLRKKLEWEDVIKTIYKMGYRLQTGKPK